MSRAQRKQQINELSRKGHVVDHALRNHLLTLLDGKADLEAAAKAFYAPAVKKVVKKRKVAKKTAKKVSKKRARKKR